jgi:hypothetical protein
MTKKKPKNPHPVQELLEVFGKEARKAFKSGGKWEYRPESAECGTVFVFFDDPYWRQVWYCMGYEIENKRLFAVCHECDSDGNWEYQDSIDVTDPGYEAWEAEYSYERSREGWREYFEFVVETGTDPLGEFFAFSDTVKVKWYFLMQQGEAGCRFMGASQNPDGPWLSTIIPDYVREYLNLKVVGEETILADFVHPDQLLEDENITGMNWTTFPDAMIRGEFESDVPVLRTEDDYREAARKALED